MKKFWIGLLVVIIILIVGVFKCGGTYMSSPGFVTEETYESFNAAKTKCVGYSFVLNAEAAAADAPEESFCIGFLDKPNR